jgi:hypothetical protein
MRKISSNDEQYFSNISLDCTSVLHVIFSVKLQANKEKCERVRELAPEIVK